MKESLITQNIIGCAIEVHKDLGPGLLESVYEECLHYELLLSGISVVRQVPIPVVYREVEMKCGFRADLIVEDQVIIEVKAVDRLIDIHKAQLMTYLKLSEMHLGLLINFNVPLAQGWHYSLGELVILRALCALCGSILHTPTLRALRALCG